MKKSYIFGMAMIIAMAFASCGSEKNLSSNNGNNNGNRILEGKALVMPCLDVTIDDENYYRDLGVGTALNPQEARNNAIKSAQSMIKQRLNGVVKGLSRDYSRKVSSSSAAADKSQSIIENGFNTAIDQVLNNAGKICEDLVKLDDGNYRSYYAIEIAKDRILKTARGKKKIVPYKGTPLKL